MSYGEGNYFQIPLVGEIDNKLHIGGTLVVEQEGKLVFNNSPGYYIGDNFYPFGTSEQDNFGPFDAIIDDTGKPNHYASEGEAILAGKSCIFNPSGSLDTEIINITRNVSIYRTGEYKLTNQAGFNFANGKTLKIYSPVIHGSSVDSNGSTLLTANPSAPFFNGSGNVELYGICLVQGGQNLVAPNIFIKIKNCQIQLGQSPNFLSLQKYGSYAQKLIFIGTAIGDDPYNALTIGNGCWADDIEYYNQTGSKGTHITIQKGGKLTRIRGTAPTGAGGLPLVILNQGLLEGLENTKPSSPFITLDGGTIQNTTIMQSEDFAPLTPSLFIKNKDSRVINVEMLGVNIDVESSSENANFLNCNTDNQCFLNDLGENTSGSLNTGGILPNINSSSANISPYEAILDGAGILPNTYINIGAAYPAVKTYVYGIKNITETANIVYNPTDQIYFQIAQNFTHSLGAFSFVGSYVPELRDEFDNIAQEAVAGGNALTIEFADASSVLLYGYSASTLPFQNFDVNSTIIIDAKGGAIRNTSTAPNTYIECLGTLSISPAKILLPNASAGGVKTNQYTKIEGVRFKGGGSACDTAIIASGGSISSSIIEGSFANNSILIQAENFTVFDTIVIATATTNTIEIWGQAKQIISRSSALGGYLTVTPKNSSLLGNYNPLDLTIIDGGTFDELAIPSGLQGCKISNCTIGLLSLPSDNSTQIDFDNCTFINNFTFYGDSSFSNCRMIGGFIPQDGSTIGLSNCRSGSLVTFSSGVIKFRSANNPNIGNDYV